MSQSLENKTVSIEDILKILRSQAQSMPPSPTSSRYLLALQSFSASSRLEADETYPSLALGPSASLRELLADWLVSMWLSGTPYSTASLNLDIISALYGAAVKAGLLPEITLFSELKAQLKSLGYRGWNSGIGEEIFARALRLTKNANLLLLDDSIAADLVILSLTHSLIPIQQLAQLKREDLAPTGEGAAGLSSGETSAARPIQLSRYSSANASLHETIIDRHCPNARKKYIFPLYQSQRTEMALKKHVFKITNALFRRARLPQSTDPNQTVEALWAYAALRTGLPASKVVAYLGHAPLGLPVLKLSAFSSLSSKDSSDADNTYTRIDDNVDHADNEKYFSQVGKVFLDNPPRWYALSLRPGVRFTQLCRRLELLDDRVPQPQLFYPCEEIARAIGKKIVIKQRPFIHSVVFFQAKLTDIGPLLSKIGDLAWCYRQSARPGAPYAEISQQQFRLFQQTIATFTPDYEVAPTGELELKKDDRVQIVGGLFAGQTASFDCVARGTEASSLRAQSKGNHGQSNQNTAPADTNPTIVYRLNIIGDNGIEWRIHADSRLLKPYGDSPS